MTKEQFRSRRTIEIKEKKILTERQRQLMAEFTELTREYLVAKGKSKIQSQLETTDRDSSEMAANELKEKMDKKIVDMRKGKFNADAVKKTGRNFRQIVSSRGKTDYCK